VIAENKDIPHFTPKELPIELDEEKPGIVDINETITVEDRDAVSKESLMCSSLMMNVEQSDLKTSSYRAVNTVCLTNKNQPVNSA
jgi:hypothetical protein